MVGTFVAMLDGGRELVTMVYCPVCKIWVQPIQWVDSTFYGHLDLLEACPGCHQQFSHPEPAVATA